MLTLAVVLNERLCALICTRPWHIPSISMSSGSLSCCSPAFCCCCWVGWWFMSAAVRMGWCLGSLSPSGRSGSGSAGRGCWGVGGRGGGVNRSSLCGWACTKMDLGLVCCQRRGWRKGGRWGSRQRNADVVCSLFAQSRRLGEGMLSLRVVVGLGLLLNEGPMNETPAFPP